MDLTEFENYPELLPLCPCGCRSELVDPTNPKRLAAPWYVEELRLDPEWAQASELEIERKIIREGWEDQFDGALVHHMRHLRLLFPWVTHDPNIVRMVTETIGCETNGRKMFHMMGHASSGKTHFMVLDAFRTLDLEPNYSEVFVASPYRTAANYLLWGAFNQAADMLRAHGTKVYDRVGVLSLRSGRWSGPGTITLVSFHAVGVLRGKKLVSPHRGRLGIYLDEAGEFTNDAILEIISNLKSQTGLRVRTGTNFRRIDGLDGKFNQPEDFNWPDLNRETSYAWNSVNGGRTIRLRAKMSPNIVLGDGYYPYLLKPPEHKDLLAYGVDSPFYLSQGDAFPSIHSVNRIMITSNDIQGAHTYEEVKLAPGSERFAFVDPSFTEHGDSAVIAVGSLGYEQQGGGQKIRCEKLDDLPVNERTVWDQRYLHLANSLRQGKPLKANFSEGELISAFDLAAMLLAEYARDNHIPYTNIAFDDSMRGALTASMIYFMGEGIESVYYGSKPTNKMTFPPEYKWVELPNKQRRRVRMTNDECYTHIAAEMWLTSCAMIRAGYLRNGYQVQGALEELVLRLKSEPKSGQSVKKLTIEPKGEYRDRNRNHSPDKADALTGLIWMIVNRKLAPASDSSDQSFRGGVSQVAALFNSDTRREPRIKRLSR